MVTIRHELYERATDYEYPVIVHEFRGKSLEEAKRYMKAHSRYDQMFRDISALGHTGGNASGVWNNIHFKSRIRVIPG
jgi:hypothetical protein